MSAFIEPECRWECLRADAILIGGPERIYDNSPEPELPRRPVGFVRPLAEVEPLTWEGDNA